MLADFFSYIIDLNLNIFRECLRVGRCLDDEFLPGSGREIGFNLGQEGHGLLIIDKSYGGPLPSKSASPPDPMEVGIIVRLLIGEHRDIVIDDETDIFHVHAPG